MAGTGARPSSSQTLPADELDLALEMQCKCRTPRVEVRHAAHSYAAREVLADVSLSLFAGEIYGLLGPNGAGKTTLLKAVCGQLKLARGEILIDGRSISKDRNAARPVGFVPQEISIFPHLTVEENLHVFGRFAGVSRRMLRRSVPAMLERAGLADRAGQTCSSLSGGYQRRVNISASLLNNPAVLLLDEPTVGIDVDAREAIHTLLKGLRDQGTAILMTTHDLDQAQVLCDRIAIMHNGRLQLEGAPAELLYATFGDDKEIIAQIMEPPGPAGIAMLERLGLRPTQSPLTWFGRASAERFDAAALGYYLGSAGVDIKELRIREPDLGSLFLYVLGAESGR